LRLGNFVSLHEGHVEFPLTRIRFERVISGYYEVEPIELTAEWMEEFGFRNDEHWYIRVGQFDYFTISCVGDSFYYSVNGGEYLIGRSIKWVHQLQNLYFAVTGKELERKTV